MLERLVLTSRLFVISLIGTAIIAFLIGLIGAGLLWRNALQSGPTTIWQDVVLKNPNYHRANLNVSLEYLEKKEYAMCLAYAQRAIKRAPNRPTGYVNAGTCAVKLGAYE